MSQKNKPVNWHELTDSSGYYLDSLVEFAEGKISGRTLSANVAFSSSARDIRQLLRTHGVSKARNLARKALRRRNLV